MDRDDLRQFVYDSCVRALCMVVEVCRRLKLNPYDMLREAERLEQLSHDEEDT